MDDSRFDDSIKKKLADYEDPEFDPSALTALHQQMASVIRWPWYSRYRTELLTGSAIAVSTLLILGSQWFVEYKSAESLEKKIQAQNDRIAMLETEIEQLKNVPPDTIRIVEIREQPSSVQVALLNKISRLEAIVDMYTNRLASVTASNDASMTEESVATAGINDYIFESDPEISTRYHRINPRTVEENSARAKPDDLKIEPSPRGQNLPVKKLRELEKHYQRGIGIKVGPVVEFSKGYYSGGNGPVSLSSGLLTDLIVSPSLSVETGVKYGKKSYAIDDLDEATKLRLPGIDESIGNLQQAEIDFQLLEIPVNIKYRYPLSNKTYWVSGAGFSPVFYFQQTFEYEYKFNSGDNSFSVIDDYGKRQLKFYPGTLNFLMGVSHQLKNKKMLETSVYYQHGLTGMGAEDTSVQYFGIRGVYWFTLR